MPVIVIWLWLRGELTHGLRTQNYRGHIYRSVAGMIAMGFGFAGLKFLPLPEVTALCERQLVRGRAAMRNLAQSKSDTKADRVIS